MKQMTFTIGDRVIGVVSGDEYVIKGVDEEAGKVWVQRVSGLGSYHTFAYDQVGTKVAFFEAGKTYRDAHNGATFHCKDVGQGFGSLIAWGVVTKGGESAHACIYPPNFWRWEEV